MYRIYLENRYLVSSFNNTDCNFSSFDVENLSILFDEEPSTSAPLQVFQKQQTFDENCLKISESPL